MTGLKIKVVTNPPGQSLLFSVPGKPQTAGSKTAYPFQKRTGGLGVRVTDANPCTKTWQNQVACAANDAMRRLDAVALFEGPLFVAMWLRMPRPKSHYRTKGGKPDYSRLREDAPEFHSGKPDVLKLARAAEDAMKGIVYRDDGQIAMEHIVKPYAAAPGALIYVASIEHVLGVGLDRLFKEVSLESIENTAA